MSEFEIDLARVGGIERQPLRLRGSENNRLSRERRASTSARSFPGIADLRRQYRHSRG